MRTYVLLIRFTQKGIEAIKQGPARLDAAKKAFQASGAEIKDFYLVTGPYDVVLVVRAPDDETVVKLALGTAAKGNIRTETLRAFTEDEYRKIVTALP
jgi:uncharacterized protein with GYD domain